MLPAPVGGKRLAIAPSQLHGYNYLGDDFQHLPKDKAESQGIPCFRGITPQEQICYMMANFLVPGMLIGLTAGLSPGPLLTLVISETLQYGRKSGIKVALAPLLTDLPIIVVTLLVFDQLKNSNTPLALISISGGLFLGYLGYENLKVNLSKLQTKSNKGQSLQKAVITNALNPNPYIFWLSVGGSFIVKGNGLDCGLFLLGFYSFSVGSKISVALVTDRGKSLLRSKYFVYLIRILGVILFGYMIVLIKNGITYLQK